MECSIKWFDSFSKNRWSSSSCISRVTFSSSTNQPKIEIQNFIVESIFSCQGGALVGCGFYEYAMKATPTRESKRSPAILWGATSKVQSATSVREMQKCNAMGITCWSNEEALVPKGIGPMMGCGHEGRPVGGMKAWEGHFCTRAAQTTHGENTNININANTSANTYMNTNYKYCYRRKLNTLAWCKKNILVVDRQWKQYLQ